MALITKRLDEAEQKLFDHEGTIKKLEEEVKKLNETIKKERDLTGHETEKENKGQKPKSHSDSPSERDQIHDLQKYICELENRLGVELSKDISSDDSALEKISTRNRPINIASDCNQFCSNAWLSAKELLDNSATGKEDERCHFLALVLMTSLNKAEADFKNARRKIIAMAYQPLQGNGVKVEEVLKDKDITAEETALGDIFRKQADRVNLSSFREAIIKEIKTSKPFKDSKKYYVKGMENYVHECALLTWKMVIQRPPMTFEMDTEKAWRTLEKIVEPAWGSNLETKKPRIQYYQYPVMYHGANVMVKGKAVVK